MIPINPGLLRRGFDHSSVKWALAVFAITFAVWAPAIANDFVDWDDLNMVVRNPRFNPPTWGGMKWYWFHPAWNLYQPVTTTLWALLAYLGWVAVPDQFGGHMNPALFHLASVLLQAGSACVLFAILRVAVRNNTAALIGSLLFAVHPLQVEPIAFVGAMNNPLAVFLGLLAIWQYLRATGIETASTSRRRQWIVGSLALILAMLAKPSAVVIPPIAFVLEYAIHRRPFIAAIRSVVPWALLAAPCVLWTKLIQHGVSPIQSPIRYRPLIVTDAVNFYLCKLFWPFQLAVDYGRTPQFVISRGFNGVVLIAPLALAILAVTTRRRAPLLTAAAVVFLVGLLPNSGLVPFDSQFVSTVSDRYACFGLVGVALAAAFAVSRFRGLTYPLIASLVGLVILTETQIATWKNGETLFRRALDVNPDSWLADTNLAVAISDRSPAEAVALCDRAITLHPDGPSAWNTLGSILMSRNEHGPAINAFRRAHELAPDDPTFAANYQKAIGTGSKK